MDEKTIDSLKNRRVLLEKSIEDYKVICAQMYLGQIYVCNHHLNEEYEAFVSILTDHISELKQVNIFLGE